MDVRWRGRTAYAALASLVAGTALVTVGLPTAGTAAEASPATCTVRSTGGGAIVPDAGTATAVAVVDAGEAAPILDVNVTMSITHAAVEELDVVLGHGSDTVALADVEIPLLQPLGSDWVNFTDTVWDDEAPLTSAYPTGAGQAPFTGPHRPTEALTAFDGDDAQGQWTLTVTDEIPVTGPGATLDPWVLTVVYDCDLDKDGIANKVDNCATTANTDQADHEGDRIGDECDPDDDNDGSADTVDNCELIPNADQRDLDDDGFGDACDDDADGDGFFTGDECPTLPAFTDTGCPTIGRSLSASYSSSTKVFKGRLVARDAPRCHKRQVVDMFRVVRGPDQWVDRDRTSRRGVWKIPRDGKRRGTFYVRVQGETIPTVGHCAAAVSDRVRVRR